MELVKSLDFPITSFPVICRNVLPTIYYKTTHHGGIADCRRARVLCLWWVLLTYFLGLGLDSYNPAGTRQQCDGWLDTVGFYSGT